MTRKLLSLTMSAALLAVGGQGLVAQERDYDTEMQTVLSRAQQAAGFDYTYLLNRLCLFPTINSAPSTVDNVPGYVADPSIAPARETWYAEPRQVFDDLYFVGGSIHSAWVLETSDGLILIDTIYPYNSEELILGGMARLGLDPEDIKYIIISHGHGDHIGGVEIVQQASGAPVVMGTIDLDNVYQFPNRFLTMTPDPDNVIRVDVPNVANAPEPMELTLGDHTIELYLVPGHTPGTLSLIFDVHDHGQPITVAYSGGTAFNFQMDEAGPGIANLENYRNEHEAFGRIAVDAGATVLITNHSAFDQAYAKSRMMPGRGYGSHPFVSSVDDVQRYFDIMVDCASYRILLFEAELAAQGQ